MTFQIGDRVRATRTENASGDCIEKGRIYMVGSLDDVGDPVLETDHEFPDVGWRDSFELYAKAGEFVVGDRVVITDADYLADRQINNAPIPPVLTVRYPFDNEVGRIDLELLWFEGQTWAAKKSRCRLATPDEIADADAVPVEGVHYHADLRGSVVHPQSIPAADFDFSMIKAGDEVVLRYKVLRDGIDDGNVMVHQPDFGGYYFRPAVFSSVIPAPKPKTLRERAIEAALGGIPGVAPSDETKGVVLAGGQVISLHALVDLVLAEVEKSR